ncbi:orotidine-5'-phosphate decarboxylase [Flavilitoribacter nigricans]|uniref:Orotidine 5'-phosphate decarboxylase n=1 Tax=Flavilitoribacter nigricans (strain ATCC 23147 / DSM 23189 / NBRC 102662 / NCIMB 1420 / SS-2) TaxID=1122177 RepID=A0A2D0N9P4_FLAN2|nr:orotidine-5'-phosphate decarboxylase [Flavilitoribacter nigricans]PHN05197.1 orotidine-5'-phosphate decarboxylase [Flavilitoribacter nigricans DSM 23189 = NBRC 102662]
MTRNDIFEQIQQKRSYLCVGLDTDINRIPKHLLDREDPVFEFNKQIIDATKDLCVSYKPNLAFYEAMGPAGWESLAKTLEYIPREHFTIADAKRGDIGNTSGLYARAFFDTLDFDAVTVAPYMGEDSVKPFLEFPGKWVILLALTSNKGSGDFQLTIQENGQPLYEKVMRRAMEWGSPEQLMFVVGATHPQKFEEIRRIAPEHFLLVPGVGAQGGDLEGLSRYGKNDLVGLLVNSSRGIIYAGDGPDFAAQARAAAEKVQQQMAAVLG